MIYIVIIELATLQKGNEILTEIYSNKQEAKLTYNVIVKSLREDKYYKFDGQLIKSNLVKSIRLLEREIICQR